MTDIAIAPSTEGHEDHAGHRTSLGLSNMKLAFWLFLGSECLLFGALISTYLLSKASFITQVVAGNPNVVETMPQELITEFAATQSVEPMFDIPFTSLSSFILLMSSLSMVLAHSAIGRGDHRNTRIWLATTALLGSLFICGQVYEFTAFYREGLGYTTSRFSSAFYSLTGFHGVHVSLGIVMLLSLLLLSLRGNLPSHRAETVEVVGLYWHFVDVVWILIFAVVYLIP
jgi:heme/copper-type cytochrome/quinol oxidase subunit 3